MTGQDARANKELHPGGAASHDTANSRETFDKMREAADKVVALLVPEEFYADGQWYENFAQTTDDEVRELLARSTARVERVARVR